MTHTTTAASDRIRRDVRRGFTMLEVAIAVGLIVTLSVTAAVALNQSEDDLNEAGNVYVSDYADQIEQTLSEGGLG